MGGDVLGGGSGAEVDCFLVEGALVPADEAEVVGGGEEEGVLVRPLHYMQGDDPHGNLSESKYNYKYQISGGLYSDSESEPMHSSLRRNHRSLALSLECRI